MAVEAKRGCGYRKVGGLYLVGKGGGMPCCKLPLPLEVCPCCNQGIKQTRGWTWIDAGKMFPGGCRISNAGDVMKLIGLGNCPMGNPASLGRIGLLWIGERFYKTPGAFLKEGEELGISRRLTAVPRDFKLGETWVALAHPKTIPAARRAVAGPAGVYLVADPDGEPIKGEVFTREELALERAAALDLEVPLFRPGVFRIFRPSAVEKVVKQSEYDRAGAECSAQVEAGRELKDLPEWTSGAAWVKDQAKGVTWIPVPDDDKDHAGTVYDKELEDA